MSPPLPGQLSGLASCRLAVSSFVNFDFSFVEIVLFLCNLHRCLSCHIPISMGSLESTERDLPSVAASPPIGTLESTERVPPGEVLSAEVSLNLAVAVYVATIVWFWPPLEVPQCHSNNSNDSNDSNNSSTVHVPYSCCFVLMVICAQLVVCRLMLHLRSIIALLSS